MCGIAGFTLTGRRSGADPAVLVAGMLEPIRHRGPDQHAVHVDRHVAFGHLRLSIVDLAGGRQPRVDPGTGDVLAFNGEIYGYRALQAELERAGVPLVDRSDTEVLFRLLQRDGLERTLARIDGMFAFAWYEGATGRLQLARDRFGEKPLYWGIAGGDLYFGSEPRALLRHPAWSDADVDPDAVRRYLHYEYLPGDRSLRRGVMKLLPGQCLTFENGVARTARYWQPHPSEQGAVAERTAGARIERLEALFEESVRERLVADVPVGVFLSGGIDSSMVAAFAARHAPGLTAFTVKMPEASYDETPAAVALAARFGMRHEIVDLTTQALVDAFEAVTLRMDEPLGDSSLLPTWVLCRAARRHATVALGGDGADELFAGYVSFKAARAARAMALMPAGVGRLLRSVLARRAPDEGYMSLAFKLAQLSRGFGLPPARQWSAWMAPFAPEELAALGLAPASAHAGGDDGAWNIARLLEAFTTTYLPEDILAKVDRASMYNSLEVRAPFLARGFAEYALALPSCDKIRGLDTKHLFKQLARRHIPAEIVDRPKHGFALPLAQLLRGPLAEPVAARLLAADSPLRAWLRPAAIERLWTEHRSGARDHRKKIWTLFTLAIAAR